jgi:hypothetical protein
MTSTAKGPSPRTAGRGDAAKRAVWVYALSGALLLAVVWPLAWAPGRDSFPLSTYPMFSHRRPSPVFTLDYAIGVDATGGRRHLGPHLVANQEVLQARAVLAGAVARGPAATAQLCARIAERVARRRGMAPVVEVHIVRGAHDAIAYLTGSDREGREQLWARCPVVRP